VARPHTPQHPALRSRELLAPVKGRAFPCSSSHTVWAACTSRCSYWKLAQVPISSTSTRCEYEYSSTRTVLATRTRVLRTVLECSEYFIWITTVRVHNWSVEAKRRLKDSIEVQKQVRVQVQYEYECWRYTYVCRSTWNHCRSSGLPTIKRHTNDLTYSSTSTVQVHSTVEC
jgi:hypothetical protein